MKEENYVLMVNVAIQRLKKKKKLIPQFVGDFPNVESLMNSPNINGKIFYYWKNSSEDKMLFGVDVDPLKKIFVAIAQEKKLGYSEEVLEECVIRLNGYIMGHLQKAMNEAAAKLNIQ